MTISPTATAISLADQSRHYDDGQQQSRITMKRSKRRKRRKDAPYTMHNESSHTNSNLYRTPINLILNSNSHSNSDATNATNSNLITNKSMNSNNSNNNNQQQHCQQECSLKFMFPNYNSSFNYATNSSTRRCSGSDIVGGEHNTTSKQKQTNTIASMKSKKYLTLYFFLLIALIGK